MITQPSNQEVEDTSIDSTTVVKKENRLLKFIKSINQYLICDINKMECHLASQEEIEDITQGDHQANDIYSTQVATPARQVMVKTNASEYTLKSSA